MIKGMSYVDSRDSTPAARSRYSNQAVIDGSWSLAMIGRGRGQDGTTSHKEAVGNDQHATLISTAVICSLLPFRVAPCWRLYIVSTHFGVLFWF